MLNNRVRLWSDTLLAVPGESFTFPSSFVKAMPTYNEPGEQIVDRRGLIHRIMPQMEPRYVVGLQLTFRLEDLGEFDDFTAAITAVDGPGKKITIGGNYAYRFPADMTLEITDAAGGTVRGTYTVATGTDVGGSTEIVVDEAITGVIVTDILISNWTLFDFLHYFGLETCPTNFADDMVVYVESEIGIDDLTAGQKVKTMRRAYMCHLVNLPPEILGSWVYLEDDNSWITLQLVVTHAATFTDFDVGPSGLAWDSR